MKRFNFLKNVTSWAGVTTLDIISIPAPPLYSLPPSTFDFHPHCLLSFGGGGCSTSRLTKRNSGKQEREKSETEIASAHFIQLKCVTGLAPRYKGIEKCIISPSMWQPQIKWKFRQYRKRVKYMLGQQTARSAPWITHEMRLLCAAILNPFVLILNKYIGGWVYCSW